MIQKFRFRLKPEIQEPDEYVPEDPLSPKHSFAAIQSVEEQIDEQNVDNIFEKRRQRRQNCVENLIFRSKFIKIENF